MVSFFLVVAGDVEIEGDRSSVSDLAEMSSFEIVDSGKFSGGRSNFSQTCNLLSQYLKENGSFGDLTLGLTTPKVEPKEIVAGDVEIEGDRSSLNTAFLSTPRLMREMTGGSGESLRWKTSLILILFLPFPDLKLNSPISVEYLLFIAGAEMSSFEIVDSGKFSGGRSNFSQTCNLLSQYLKENGSFGDLTLGLTTPKVEPKEIVAGDVEIEGDRSSLNTAFLSTPRLMREMTGGSGESLRWKTSLILILFLPFPDLKLNSPISVEYLLFIAGAEMSSFEIVDSGKFSGGRSNFSQTCNLLSQYLKENGSFGDLTLGLTTPKVEPKEIVAGDVEIEGDRSSLNTAFLSTPRLMREMTGGSGESLRWKTSLILILFLPFPDLKLNSPISVEYLLFIAGAEMSSFEIVDSGKFSGGRSNFSQTCNLLSQYLKENGSFGDLTLGLTTPKVEPKEIVAGDVEIEGDRSSVSDLGEMTGGSGETLRWKTSLILILFLPFPDLKALQQVGGDVDDAVEFLVAEEESLDQIVSHDESYHSENNLSGNRRLLCLVILHVLPEYFILSSDIFDHVVLVYSH
ncbi:hypothetical protein BUALT_Bualt15G0094000 [Buddleja alternifolia]|uniref:Uncharacterized protein n=1 Tax=Buddleja alternifolia TaxID=168488 RepID=A0AAV6WDU2_9LAMI|nr:hypothetical protein BUALT_Bualt15G0094000 [Buddleja alternifolia]